MRYVHLAGAAITALLLAGCAYTATPGLTHPYDLSKGYRFERLSTGATTMAKNSDELFVVLAFSGGGTRAAALSYGVLDQLRHVTFPWDDDKKIPCGAGVKGCRGVERTLLDEVDVISSVSGGSFTAAYYALNRAEMFSPSSRFHTQFLYYPIQRDLVSRAAYWPKNWTHLLQRVEIAADLYADRVFGDARFGALEGRGRPYLIMNATDASTGNRFEFTQEQFDIICADLSQVPIVRGVTASSAFPGLLNSMTIDARRRGTCDYQTPDWVALAKGDAGTSYGRFQAAREIEAYLDGSRPYLHLLDGGLADNIGLRSVLQSLNSTDRPEPNGGWTLLNKINREQVKTILVVTVNARTNRRPGWDRAATGPVAPTVVAAAAGIPMGKYSTETIELLRQYGFEAELNTPGQPRFVGVEVAFENLETQEERDFFSGLGTNFELDAFEVDCLRSRGARLLRQSVSVTEPIRRRFAAFVGDDLGGRIDTPAGPAPVACTAAAGKSEIAVRSHYVDVGYQHTWTRKTGRDVVPDTSHGFTVRVTKPNGFGATIGYSGERFGIRTEPGSAAEVGELTLHTASAGLLYGRRLGRLEASLGLSTGFGVGRFAFDRGVRDARIRQEQSTTTDASNAWVIKPALSFWYNLSSRWAATFGGHYVYARPSLRTGAESEPARALRASGVRLSAGVGVKVF